jgi:hypothetical protein
LAGLTAVFCRKTCVLPAEERFSTALEVLHHRDQFLRDLYRHGTNSHNEQRWKNTKENRKYKLHAELRGLLFRNLPGLDTHEVRMPAEALRYARPEPVGLNQHRDKLLQVIDIRSFRQITQSFHAAFARFQL